MIYDVPYFVSDMKQIISTWGLEHVWPKFKENRVCIYCNFYYVDVQVCEKHVIVWITSNPVYETVKLHELLSSIGQL